MEELKEILWRCFVTSNIRRNPNDPECMRNRDFVEIISKDIKLSPCKLVFFIHAREKEGWARAEVE